MYAEETTDEPDNVITEERTELVQDTNQVRAAGFLAEKAAFSHELYGEKFYLFTLRIPRLSGQSDLLPVLCSERLPADPAALPAGAQLTVTGQFRSYNNTQDSSRSRLLLSVFARGIQVTSSEGFFKTENSIFLDGFLCKPPIYRTTPFGREIADLLVAVNRAFNKSDYIPCIAWGRNARFSEKLKTGTRLRIHGRIQSRTYEKKMADGRTQQRTAYEISVIRLEIPGRV